MSRHRAAAKAKSPAVCFSRVADGDRTRTRCSPLDTYGKFSTGSWCWPATTTTEHKKTWFEGRPNGGWWWSYSADKSGACSGLLHYDYLLTTP